MAVAMAAIWASSQWRTHRWEEVYFGYGLAVEIFKTLWLPFLSWLWMSYHAVLAVVELGGLGS